MYGYKYTENCVNMNIHEYIHMYVYAHLCVALAEMRMVVDMMYMPCTSFFHVRPSPRHAADAGAPQPGEVLCARDEADEICPYDVQMTTWRRVRENFLQRREDETQVDISDGHLFPWWLLLGNTGRQRPLLNRGVTHVVASGCTLVVTLLDGEVVLSSNRHQRMELQELIVD